MDIRVSIGHGALENGLLRPLIAQDLNLKGRAPVDFHLAFPIPIGNPILIARGGGDPKG